MPTGIVRMGGSVYGVANKRDGCTMVSFSRSKRKFRVICVIDRQMRALAADVSDLGCGVLSNLLLHREVPELGISGKMAAILEVKKEIPACVSLVAHILREARRPPLSCGPTCPSASHFDRGAHRMNGNRIVAPVGVARVPAERDVPGP